MKKILVLFTVIAFAMNVALAQEATKARPNKEAKKEVKAEKRPAKSAKIDKVKNEEQPQSADDGAKATATPVKKDGTPDMRYKENKEGAKPVEGPKKKDGTPDKRYKENKETKEVKK